MIVDGYRRAGHHFPAISDHDTLAEGASRTSRAPMRVGPSWAAVTAARPARCWRRSKGSGRRHRRTLRPTGFAGAAGRR